MKPPKMHLLWEVVEIRRGGELTIAKFLTYEDAQDFFHRKVKANKRLDYDVRQCRKEKR